MARLTKEQLQLQNELLTRRLHNQENTIDHLEKILQLHERLGGRLDAEAVVRALSVTTEAVAHVIADLKRRTV
jgi:hypothetical protein